MLYVIFSSFVLVTMTAYRRASLASYSASPDRKRSPTIFAVMGLRREDVFELTSHSSGVSFPFYSWILLDVQSVVGAMLSEMTTTMDVTGSAATALLDEIRGVRFGPAATTSAASGALSLSDSSASRLVAPPPSPQTSTSEESEAQDVCRGCGVVALKEILTEQVLDRRARRWP